MRKYLEVSNSRNSILFWSTISGMLVASITLLYFLNETLYIFLSQEDSFFEVMTVILYFLAGSLLIISSITILRRSKVFWKELLTLFLGLFFIFIAGEEISWGQRIFDISATEIVREYNVQNEFTIHNLVFFSNSLILDQHRLLNLFALLTGLVLPLVYRFHKKLRILMNLINFPIVPLSCSVLFGLAIVYEMMISRLYPHWVHPEVKEFFFSVGYFIFSISLYTRKNRLENG